MAKHIVTVFGSAFPKEGSEGYATAYELGRLLSKHGFTVCNGGYGGVMEASARGAKDAGGTTIGVVAEAFGTEANRYIDRTIVAKTHVERLLKLIELGDAYVVLRGGTGTLVELATVWEYMNKGLLTKKPFVALGNSWTKVIETINDEMKFEGRTQALGFVTIVSTAEECVEKIKGGLLSRRS